MNIRLCIYSDYAVIRDGVYLGTVTSTPSRALDVAQDEYGAGVLVRHIASMPEKQRDELGIPFEK